MDQGARRGGRFCSVEEAARQLIDDRIAELAHDAGDEHDMAWAKPLVDEGLAALERGDFITLEEHKARNAARAAGAPEIVARVVITEPADA